MELSSSLKANPLVNPPKQDFDAPPLGLFKPEHVEPAVEWAIERAKENVEAIKSNPDTPTFENTIHALAFADEQLGTIYGAFSETKGVMNDETMQKVSAAILPKLSAHSAEIALDADLFERIKTVYDTVDRSKLNVEEEILLDNAYNGFKNSGALLKGKKREKYKKLSQHLSKLTMTYTNNITNSAAELNVVVEAKDKNRLKGVPADVLAVYQQAAKDDPNTADDAFLIGMVPPPFDLFEYADDRSLREEVRCVYDKIAAEGQYDNHDVVKDIVKTRYELARLLGFKNHAERTIRPDTRMAESVDTVTKFLANNKKAYEPSGKQFKKDLAAFAKKRDGIKIERWDESYYIRLMREEEVGFDPEEARPYFELENTLKGMFEHSRKLYNINVREVKGKYSRMHDDVRTYEILDADTGDVKSLFYLDPYARKGKKGGAWMSDIRNAGLSNGEAAIPIIGNYCNFQKPAKGKPTLLTPSEVETLFHEFGHACHGIMGQGTYPELTGINTPWDYVELPSQINERWAFKPSVLKTYAKHYQTGKDMPKSLVDTLQTLNQFDARWQGIRQTELAMLDMALYTADPKDIKDLKEFHAKALGRKPSKKTKGGAPVRSLTFAHIMSGGYSAGYHSYKWADVLVADVFEQFEEQGLYNGKLCKAFREKMIEPGGTRRPSKMFKDFMEAAGQGRRDIDSKALLRYEGLLPAKKAAPANDNSKRGLCCKAKPPAPKGRTCGNEEKPKAHKHKKKKCCCAPRPKP